MLRLINSLIYLRKKGTKGFANPKAHSYTSLRPANTWHEGVGHNVKNKILNLQDAIERNNNIEQFIKDYESMKYGLIDTDISFTAEQASILEKYDKNTYFTQEESQFIIKYLMNCLVYNEPFDCSSLGPNKYLNE